MPNAAYFMKSVVIGMALGSILVPTNMMFSRKYRDQILDSETSKSWVSGMMAKTKWMMKAEDIESAGKGGQMVPEATPPCPHSTFMRKHVCKNCLNEEDALEFSIKRQEISYTNVNTVIFGDPEFEFDQETRLCRNRLGQKVMTCTISNEMCRMDGENCTTFHSTGNGHLYYRDTKCQ